MQAYSLYDLTVPYNTLEANIGDHISVSGSAWPKYRVVAKSENEMWIKDVNNGKSYIIGKHDYTSILERADSPYQDA
jgi:tricorn protease-like protein